MGLRRPSVSATAVTLDGSSLHQAPELSINTQPSPQPEDSNTSTPHSSPWRENPAFLPPNSSASSSQPAGTQSSVARNILPDVTDKLADMSVVGSGLQRGQSQDARELAARIAREAAQIANSGGSKAHALGRLKDRQQQGVRKTSEDESQGAAVNPAPAKYYLQVPIKPFKP